MKNSLKSISRNANLKIYTLKNKSIITKIESLSSTKTPTAIGAYSKATRLPISKDINLIFCSGSLGVNASTGELVSDSVKDQTVQSLENLKNLLE